MQLAGWPGAASCQYRLEYCRQPSARLCLLRVRLPANDSDNPILALKADGNSGPSFHLPLSRIQGQINPSAPVVVSPYQFKQARSEKIRRFAPKPMIRRSQKPENYRLHYCCLCHPTFSASFGERYRFRYYRPLFSIEANSLRVPHEPFKFTTADESSSDSP